MVQIPDFTLNVIDPLAAVRQGLQFGQAQALRPELLARDRANFERKGVVQGQQDTLFAQGQEDRQSAQAIVAKARARASQIQTDLENLSENPTAAGFMEVTIKYPEIANELKVGFNQFDSKEKQANLLFMGQVYSSIQGAIKTGDKSKTEKLIQDRVDALNNTQGKETEAKQTEALLGLFTADPESARTSIGVAMSVLGNGQFDSLLGKGPSVVSSQILADGSTLMILRDGTRRVLNPAGEIVTGADAVAVIEAANQAKIDLTGGGAFARQSGRLEATIGTGGEAKAAEAAGAQAIATSGNLFDQFSKTRTSIATIQAAIIAIDNGAKAGLIYKQIPNITKSSASLQNSLDKMGLDIISATTFGALSEGEMRLAMQTAAPRNLSAPNLRIWLLEKQTAQEKVATMLLNAAQFLGTPGNTLADWIAKNKSAPDATTFQTPDANAEADAFFGGGQ